MAMSVPFVIDAVEGPAERWQGLVSIDENVLLPYDHLPSEQDALLVARAGLVQHLSRVFVPPVDREDAEEEHFDTLVELDAAIVIRSTAGWALATARALNGGYLATLLTIFTRDQEVQTRQLDHLGDTAFRVWSRQRTAPPRRRLTALGLNWGWTAGWSC